MFRVETCSYLEAYKISLGYLTDLEKAYYGDKNIAKEVSFYINYFKNKDTGKSKVNSEIFWELFLLMDLESASNGLEKLLLTKLGIDKKAYLHDKMTCESESLNNFAMNS